MKTCYSVGAFFKYELIRKSLRSLLISFIPAMMFVGLVYGQNEITVTGEITDDNNDPLPGATILVEGREVGTTTELDGTYSIDVDEDAILVFSFVGYERQRIAVEGRIRIDVMLESLESMLNEVVVIGYGEESRKKLTTSIGSVNSSEIDGLPVPTVSNAIQGKVSGVRINHSNGGQPGAPPEIRVRGGSSITGSNSPMILVDGIERPNLRDLNSRDVESIEVLKDASATAIYGSRASNGVILVTTKSGVEGESELAVDYSLGISSPSKRMDLLNGEQFINLIRPAADRAVLRQGLSDINGATPFGTGNGPFSAFSPRYWESENVPKGWKTMPDPLNPDKTIIYTDTDWQDVAFQNALEHNFDLTASGGTENLRYYGGFGYTNSEGTGIGTKWDRFSGRVNVDFDARENITIKTNVNTTVSNTNTYRSFHHIFGRSLWLAPTARLFMPDGSYGYGANNTYTNPLFYNDVNDHETVRRRLQLGTNLIWNSINIEGLNFQVSADYYYHDNKHERFEKANIYDSSRDTRINQDFNDRVKTDALLSYTAPMFGNHAIKIVAGGAYEHVNQTDINTRARGGATDLIQTLNAAPEMVEAYSFKREEALTGLFSRLSYDYKEKYLFTASIRRDASSRFASENRVGYFPGLSAGWIITNEDFFPESPISLLKLRGSWGETGNVVSGFYTPYGEYTVGRNYYNEAGAFPVQMPNYALRWESTSQWDIGLDLGLLNDRFVIVFDVYDKVTNGLLFNRPLPRVTGFNNIQQNVGSVRFNGWELELDANIISNTDFSWDMNFNFSYNSNEVISLPDNGRNKNRIGGIYNPETDRGVGGIAEGERLGAVTGLESAFIIDTQEQANNAHFDESAQGCDPETGDCIPGRKFPGDMEWVDQNGDGVINQYDNVVLGYDRPDKWGGFSNTFSYRNLTMKVHMDFTIGHTTMDATKRRGDGNAIGGVATPTTDMLNAWQKEGDVAAGRADMPRLDFHDAAHQANIHRDHDRVAYRADFLSLREVMVSYNLPNRIAQNLGMSGAALYLRGQNLYYFTEYPVFNPEFEGRNNNYGGNSAEYPIPRKFLAGINIKF